ncbi:argininosuccinate lyase [Hyalangium gracile]|uniref:argininosuccinate lyase n=1 Tax=Hyalangium gracile TaxID=394092 RepID=UPI001CCAD794|nr:argininosuccinate lyase [Hyalangium gracile]
MSAQGIGRISRPPHPVLFKLLYEPSFADDRQLVLPHLLRIDAAHLVMLARQRILPTETAARLLAVNASLRTRVEAGEAVFEPPPTHRGLYLMYEQEYIHQLGGEVGGAAHVARSRNDINATVTRMRLRRELLELLGDCEALAARLRTVAREHTRTLMSAFTHLQPAQPGTLGHYLTAVLSELTRGMQWLAGSYATVNRCPMGAAAGGGTSFPIDPGGVARLLGFSEPIANSIDAVASRDYVIQVLSALAMLGSTLTRLATDLQSWASNAFGFLDWPDELVSTSSIMPQKRNAFVLENIRGQAVYPAGALVNALMGMKNTAYANSVEVSGEAAAHVWPAAKALRKALRLMELLLQHVEARPEGMRDFLVDADTTMTAVADHLVSRHGLAFRTAHDVVGRYVAQRPAGTPHSPAELKARLEELLAQATSRPVPLDEAELAQSLDPEACMRAAAYGGGPAPEAVLAQLETLSTQSVAGQLQAWRQELDGAETLLLQQTRALIPEPQAPSGR